MRNNPNLAWIQNLAAAITRWLWVLVLITIPVTSFRHYPSFLGQVSVSPLSLAPMVPLAALLVLWVVLKKHIPFPRQGIPLVVFLFVAAISSFAGFYLQPVEFEGISYIDRVIRAWFTVVTGLMYFWVAFYVSYRIVDLQRYLPWIYIGLAATFVWGSVQILSIYTNFISFEHVIYWQETFSITELVGNKRVQGFAYEPSWLADQLTTIFIPWLLAAFLTNTLVTRWKWVDISLLAMAVVLLLFTISRGGILVGVVMAATVITVAGSRQIVRAWRWLVLPFRQKGSVLEKSKLSPLVIRVAILTVILLVLVTTVAVLSQHNYFAVLLTFDPGKGIVGYFTNIRAGPRFAYALAGLKTFSSHPWLGVGLGASGFYLPQNLPDWSRTFEVEIARVTSPLQLTFLNPKNMYIRLLSETGIFGFWLYITFLLSVLGQVVNLLKSTLKEQRFLGVAGLAIWVAVVLGYLTQDSFAMPNAWLGFGMLLGAAEAINIKNKECKST